MKIADDIGNLRLDGVTVGVSSDIGGHAGFVVVIVRGQYNAKSLSTKLQKDARATSALVDGAEVLALGNEFSILPLSDNRLIIVGGSDAQKLPTTAEVVAAVRSGKGKLDATVGVGKLIKAIDTTQPLWLAVSMSDAYKRAPVLNAFDSLTLVGTRQKEGGLALGVKGTGSDAKAVADAVEQVNAGIGMFKEQMKQARQIPGLESIQEAVESLKVSADGANANASASWKGNANMLMMIPGMMFHQLQAPPPAPAPAPAP